MAQRRGGTAGWRRWVVGAVCVFAAVVLTFLSRDQDSRPLGRYLFFAAFGYALVHLAATLSGTSSRFFSEDRRHRTLGLLFLTGLKPGEIMLGKFFGVYATLMWPVLAALPMLAFALLMGGISEGVLLASVETLLVLPFLMLSIQMAASIVTEDEHAAEVGAIAVFAALALGPPVVLVGMQIATGVALAPDWFVWGPANAVWQLFQGTREHRVDVVFTGNAVSLCYALVFLGASRWCLKRAWRSEVEGEGGGIRRLTFWRRMQSRAATGVREFLETQPYVWLVARDARPKLLAWGSLVALMCLWVVGWVTWPADWLTPFTFWSSCLVLGMMANGVVHYAAGRQIAEDRRSGSLELLLTTGMSPAEIVEAHGGAIRQVTGRFILVVGALYGWFFTLGVLAMKEWTIAAFIIYGSWWTVLIWLGPWARKGQCWQTFWVSLNTGRVAYGLRKHTGALWNLPILVMLYANGTLFALLNTPKNDEGIAGILGIGAVVMLLVWYFTWREQGLPLRQKAEEEFRHIAAQPVPAAGDARLKSWDMQESLFPMEEEPPEYPRTITVASLAGST